MGLVDYDSDGSGSSDGEATVAAPPAKTTTTTAGASKKPFQKLVDRANPGKILVNLPSAAATTGGGAQEGDDDGRPAKRAKVGAGGSRFSGFGSFLPPPKKTGAAAATSTTTTSKQDTSSPHSSSATSRPGVNLKTSSEAAFSRRDNGDGDALPTGGDDQSATGTNASSSSSLSSRMALPPPKAPSIPRDQKAAEDVKFVGNPLMFMPLSVSRKPGGKKKKPVVGGGGVQTSTGGAKQESIDGSGSQPNSSATPPAAPPPKKKVSLFSLGADDQAEAERASAAERAAEEAAAAAAERGAAEAATNDYQSVDYSSTYQAPSAWYGYEGQQGSYGEDAAAAAPTEGDATSLSAFANNMNLSAKERRELFGRTGSAAASVQIAATFNMDQEYRHNEALRQAEEGAVQAAGGQQQSHNPVRTLMPGKHSLRQLVNAVHTQQDALEETFVKNRQSQREAGGKYGWR